jgi:alginate O-acetyltransferase complex protein AlgJ
MYPVMQSASRLNGIAFILLLVVMCAQSIPTLLHFAAVQQDSWKLFVDGKLLRRFETYYDKRSFLREPSVKVWAGLRYLLFREGTPGVVLGQHGWLYTNQEYLLPGDLPKVMDAQLSKIAQVREVLAQHGKSLLVLPVPLKVDIHIEHVSYPPSPRALNLYDDFVQQLQAHSVDVVPLRLSFQAHAPHRKLYMRNDTHWSPDGARLAAQTLATTRPELHGPLQYRSYESGHKQHQGDLLNFVQFTAQLQPQIFLPTELTLYETLRIDQPVDATALFADQSPSLALVGTSYSKDDNWNFAGFLREALGCDVINFSEQAYGPFHAMDQFLNSSELANPDIRHVLWEFPLRTLQAQKTLLNRSPNAS